MRVAFSLVLIMILAACESTKLPVVTGVPEELARHRKSTISELSYDLSFVVPEQKLKQVKGSATISFSLKNAKQDLQLDFKGDTTIGYTVNVNGKEAKISIRKGHLVVSKSLLKSGQNEIKLNFDCPDWSLNRNPEFLYTLLVPDRASTLFPCFDQPDLKAKFKLRLQIPHEWKAVANGSLENEVSDDSVKTLDFKPTQPLPTYLFAFTAGKFDTIGRTQNGRKVLLYHREKEEEIRNHADSVFSLIFRSLSWIENYTGIPYPFEKYDLVAIPSFQYNGMEHPGAMLYRASTLFPDAKPTRQQLLKRANLIAHETAHMWFGDLVTMPWFDEVWLKEVFANFIADKVVSPLFTEFNFDLQFLLAHYDVAYSVDRTSGANAIGQKLANMKDAGSLYGSIIYHKAPIVMRMLEQKTGEAALQKGLQQYLSKNAYGNAGWQELIGILNSGQTSDGLIRWSESWVNEPGRPHLKASVDGRNVMIEQTDPFGKNRIWPQKIEMAFLKEGEIFRQKIKLDAQKVTIENVFPDEKPEWVYLNTDGKTYGLVKMDTATTAYFLKNFAGLNDDVLRASVLTDLQENMHEGLLQPEELVSAMIAAVPKETNPVIYERLLSYLEFDLVYRLSVEKQQAFQEQLEAVLWSEYSERKDQQTALINTIIRIAHTPESLAGLENWLNQKESKLSVDQQNELAYQLALKLPAKAKTILDQQELRLTNPDKKAQFQFVRQSLNPEEIERDRFFESLLKEENREHEPWVDQALAYLNHPLRQTGAVKYIRPALDELQEIQQTGDIFFPKSWLDNLLKGHNSREAGELVRQFLTDHPDYPESLKMKILQSADHLLRR